LYKSNLGNNYVIPSLAGIHTVIEILDSAIRCPQRDCFHRNDRCKRFFMSFLLVAHPRKSVAKRSETRSEVKNIEVKSNFK